jgi:hypothetical protein
MWLRRKFWACRPKRLWPTSREKLPKNGAGIWLAQELTFLSIMGSELSITVTSSPSRAPLHEGMRFVVAWHTEVASQFSTIPAAVSLAAQSIISHLPMDVP